MRGEDAQLGVGQQSQRFLGDRERVQRVVVGPQQQDREVHPRHTRRAGPSGRRAASAWRPSPRSGRGCRCRRGPCGRGGTGRARPAASVAVSRSPRLGRRSTLPARARARSAPGTTAARTTTLPAFSSPLRGRLGVHAVRQQDQPRGRQLARRRSPAARAARRRRGRPPRAAARRSRAGSRRAPRSATRACRDGAGGPRCRRAAAGRAARRGGGARASSTTGSNSRWVSPCECNSANGGPVPASR